MLENAFSFKTIVHELFSVQMNSVFNEIVVIIILYRINVVYGDQKNQGIHWNFLNEITNHVTRTEDSGVSADLGRV